MATTEFKVFHGVGAVVAQVTSHTEISVLAITSQDPVDFSMTGRLFKVDLTATPLKTSWSDVKFDDRGVSTSGDELGPLLNVVSLPLGVTTLGSGSLKDLIRGRFVGAVYVERDYYRTTFKPAAIDPAPWPGDYCELYQITSVAYSHSADNGERAGRRYHGFRGHVTGVAGRLVQVKFQLKDAPTVPVLGPWWFNLDDPKECDSDPPSEALAGALSLSVAPIATGATGALFIALPHAAALGLSGPKLPIGLAG